MPKGVYLHIPFCEHICYYCDFNKVFLHRQPVWDYLHALKKEMRETMEAFPPETIETIFVGGGTPTALNEKQMAFFLESIQEHIVPRAKHIEFTVEANPGNLSREKLSIMKEAGVNRLSIGAQTFNDDLLKAIGRTHQGADVIETVELARDLGFNNLSIDVMYRLPQQSIQMLEETLQKVIALDVEHVSIYSLQVEPRTIFYNRLRKGDDLSLPTHDEEGNMYERIIDKMMRHGFDHYEISNFAKPGYESNHNLIYWNNNEYYGIGAGAHSYVGGRRRANAGPIKKYIRLVGEKGLSFVESHNVTQRERMEEEIFLGLRKMKGFSKSRFHKRFNTSIEEVFGGTVKEFQSRQLLQEKGDQISLTKRGIFLGNEVFQAFLES